MGKVCSLLDGEQTSSSHGCFDRTWWCWKFTDFPASRLQEGIFSLCWLLTSDLFHLSNVQKNRLLDKIEHSILFWASLQHNDGSFDEAYPYERSLAATAFTTFYVGSGIELIENKLSNKTKNVAATAIKKASIWLSKNNEHHGILSNHLAAAAGALQIATDLLKTDVFIEGRNKFLNIIYNEQDKQEGWFKEYGGADPGYQSHGMFYLADILKRTNNKELLERLKIATDFISWFVHPDGTIGGEYASRGTKFAFPAAFEMLAEKIPIANSIATHLRKCLGKGRGISPNEADIWNFFPLLNNYIFANDACKNTPVSVELPINKDIDSNKIFPNAGLAIFNKNNHQIVIGLNSGGIIKSWEPSGKLYYENCGYVFKEKSNYFSSQSASSWEVKKISNEETMLTIKTNFQKVKNLRFSSWRFILFRIFMLTIGRFSQISCWLKN
jgi:hypothetical protein